MLLAGLLAVSAGLAPPMAVDVWASSRATTASAATAGSPHGLPFYPRDQKAYAAQKQLVLQDKAGRRQGVVAIAKTSWQPARALAPLTEQKLAGFPVMDLQTQVLLHGFDQANSPPDTQLAAGPTDLVEADNSTLSIWTKSGSLMRSYDINTFFPLPSGFVFTDPRILYDAESARWFLSGLAFDGANLDSEVFIGVSATSDPTGVWKTFPLAFTAGVIHDQPMTGVSTDKVAISWNDFSGTSANTAMFSGAQTWVLQKSDLLAGVAPRHFAFAPDANRFRFVPALSLTPTSTEWIAYNNADCAALVCTTGSPTVGVIAITGTPAGNNVAATESDPAIQATTAPPSPRQPSGTPVVGDNDDRFLSAVWQNGTLWMSGTDACMPTGDSSMRACMRLVAISTSGATPTVTQDFDGMSNGVDLYYPAVTLDSSGNLFIAYSESSPSEFPTASAVAISAAAPGIFENAITLAPGLGSYTGSRWGDYSAAVPDPANPGTVWVTAEYQASAALSTNWGTATARLGIKPSNSELTTMTPERLLDTRSAGGRLGPGRSLSLTVAGGSTGAPANASAVVINVTVTKTTAASFLTVYPTGSAKPLASNLNWVRGQTIPNLVVVPVGDSDQVTFFNAAGSTDLVIDLEGYFAAPSGPAGGYQPLAPARILDTRTGNGAPPGKLGSAQTLNLQVTGRGGVPSSGVSAVVMNVTATNPSTAGFLTVFPAGAPKPLASNLNFTAGETVPNRVVVGVGAGGQVSIFNGQGSTNVIADVGGYFTDASATGQLFSPLAPLRVLDTRSPKKTLGPGGSIDLSIGPSSVLAGATAVILNVTVTNTTASSFLTVYPTGTGQPLASDLNWVKGKTVPNLVVVGLGGGSITLFNKAGSADVIVDIFGFFSLPAGSLNAIPISLPADGSSTSKVTATITHSDGTPQAGDSVTFSTGGGASCGTIAGSPMTTDASGKATVTYTASTTAGSCSITATEAIGNLSGSITITQT
jgi:Bacterial Ig-like domain (group 1)